MNISNLSELLNASMQNEGSTLSVGGFALNLNEVKPSFAFFSNLQEEADEAIKKGAFVVVFDKELKISDKEVFYLKVENLENALFRLLRFLCESASIRFLLVDKNEFHFSKAFYFKNLSMNVFLDFKSLTKAKKGEFFCSCDKHYLLKFCASFESLKEANFKLLSRSSLFWTNFLYKDLFFKNLNFPFIYAGIFAKFVAFLEEKGLEIRFNLNILNFFKIYFVDKDFKIVKFGESSRAFILVFDECDFEFFDEHCKNLKGFKTARKNSLFCDFSFNEIANLKSFKDFRYCLVLNDDEEDFLEVFKSKENKELSLFE